MRSRALGAAITLAVLAGLAACGGSSGGSSGTTTTAAKAKKAPPVVCNTGVWPTPVANAPTVMTKDTSPNGYFLWRDTYGWHVRAVDSSKLPQTYQGSISSPDAPFTAVAAPHGAPVTINKAGNAVTFSIPGGTAPTGVDLELSCAVTTIRFTLNDGANNPIAPAQVWVGDTGTATANPLILQRQKTGG